MVYTKNSIEDITKWLKIHLNEERYLHSIGTADCAKKLALKFNLDCDKAYIAGLLHDCAKCFPKDELFDIVNNKIDILDCERISNKTLHAPVSAYIASTEFRVEDKEILSSIRWHTLGKLSMSNFEKIIFLADKIEPNTRTGDYCTCIRAILNNEMNLDKALLQCYKFTIISLVDRNLKICPLTIDIYNELQTLLNE